MRLVAAITIMMLPFNALASGNDGAYFICSRMEAPEARLACYDEVARRQQSPQPSPAGGQVGQPVAVGDWFVSRDRDRMTDRAVTVFMLSTPVGSDGTRSRRALFVRCNESGIDVYFNSGDYLGTGRGIPVRFRLDDRPAVNQTWAASVRGNIAFASDPRGFVGAITGGARTLLIEATGYTGQRFREEFTLTGVEELASEMKACPVPGRRR